LPKIIDSSATQKVFMDERLNLDIENAKVNEIKKEISTQQKMLQTENQKLIFAKNQLKTEQRENNDVQV
jgi:hypothetical protein